MKNFEINTDYIKLQQFLKMEGFIDMGSQAKVYISENKIFVNKIQVFERGKKLRKNDEIEINGEKYLIV